MQRVMIIGLSGAGKSTFALKLGAITGLPVFHCDQLSQPGGKLRRRDRKRILREELARNSWISEGGTFAGSERLALADTVVWLDRGFCLRLFRVALRNLRYRGQTRPGAPEHWKEKPRLRPYRSMWRMRLTQRDMIVKLVASAPEEKTVFHFRSDRETEAFLDALRP